MKTPSFPGGTPSSPDKRNFKQPADLFHESLPPLVVPGTYTERASRDKIIIPSVFGKGHYAYIEAKRWIETNYPNITPAQYAQACLLAARVAEV